MHRHIAVFFALTVFLCSAPVRALAQSAPVTVTPVIVDEKGKPRDIIKKTVRVLNATDRKLNLYPSVNNIDRLQGEQEFEQAGSAEDRADSLANWIELSRGVIELGPGEEKEIPFTIRINMNAVPGTYHAAIAFTEGTTREGAEAVPPAGEVAVNIEVLADIKESMQLLKFITDNVFFSGDDVLFNYQLENIGNQELQPRGEIRVYDRKGQEVASIDVNTEGKIVSPDQVAQLASVWNGANGFGKFKAFLNVDYGKNQKASVQDTVFFWIVPWQQLLALFVVSLGLIIGMALYFLRVFERRYHPHLALAGAHGAPAPLAAPAPSPAAKKGGGFMSFLHRAKKAGPRRPAPPERGEAPHVHKPHMHHGAHSPHAHGRAHGYLEHEHHHLSNAAHGDTIDLKDMPTHRVKAKQNPTHHVINLKNR